jgi:hypothetical protein
MEKTTIKKFAYLMQKSEEAIRHHIRILYPDKMEEGKITYLTNQEMIEIKERMTKSKNKKKIKLPGELSAKIKSLDDVKKLKIEESINLGIACFQFCLENLKKEKKK